MEVIALLPTIFRPEGLTRAIDSLQRTSRLSIVVAAEPDDAQAHGISYQRGLTLAICKEKRMGCAYAWNTAFSANLDGDIYILASDDCEFKEGWYEAAFVALGKIGGSGMVGFHSMRNEALVFHYMMTRDFIIEHHGGVAAVPHYSSWCVDTEARERAQKAGKYIKAMDAIVLHEPTYSNDDEGYRLGKERRKENKQLFYNRRAQGFPDDFPPILRKRVENERLVQTIKA